MVEFNTLLLETERSSRQKNSKYIKDLNNNINSIDLTCIKMFIHVKIYNIIYFIHVLGIYIYAQKIEKNNFVHKEYCPQNKFQ